MKDKPILFSTPMVQAILEDRKTRTSRVIKPQPYLIIKSINVWGKKSKSGLQTPIGSKSFLEDAPYQVGQKLYVRETWTDLSDIDNHPIGTIAYKASIENADRFNGIWKPSIHMPKEYARIWLEVTGVRVERIQDISDGDIEKEGIIPNISSQNNVYNFRDLWDSVYAKRGASWDNNPFVWVIEFKRVSNEKTKENK